MVWPGALKLSGLVDLSTLRPGVVAALTSAVEVPVSGDPVGGWPVAVAVLVIPPASTSPWVVTWVAVQVMVPPGASGPSAGVQLVIGPNLSSLRLTALSVTLPVLVIT